MVWSELLKLEYAGFVRPLCLADTIELFPVSKKFEMSLLSQTLERAVAEADFSAIQQAVVELILQKDGHALSKELARRKDLSTFVSRLFLFCNHGIKHN